MGIGRRRWSVLLIFALIVLGFSAVSGPADDLRGAGNGRTHFQKLIASPASRSVKLAKLPQIGDVLPRSLNPSTELLHDIPIRTLPPRAPASLREHLKKPRVLTMEVTAYCACKKCCGSRAQGLTATGRPITFNGGYFIAADTKLLPFGTKVSVPGYNDDKPVEVIDRGGAIKGYHIDIFMATHLQAVEWGKKRLQITVVE